MTDLEVESNMAGKAVECHKCHNVQTVPLPDFIARVECPYCNEHTWDQLTEEEAGTMQKCPKCHHMVRIPGQSKGCSFTACILLLVGFGLPAILYSLMR
ncbi:hypothetical protein AYO44_01390 [Planctomycetaceae bacterium SCGC AG-212-F19]|nr:hypothetical protein AYO44_01390 [Planctomycetaceae bacterium SCGC AG-212-F19]